mgnify:CR=1 FL=1
MVSVGVGVEDVISVRHTVVIANVVDDPGSRILVAAVDNEHLGPGKPR